MKRDALRQLWHVTVAAMWRASERVYGIGWPGRLFLFWGLAVCMFGGVTLGTVTVVSALVSFAAWDAAPLELVWSWTGLRVQGAIVAGVATACCFTKEAYSVWRKP